MRTARHPRGDRQIAVGGRASGLADLMVHPPFTLALNKDMDRGPVVADD